MGGYEEGWRTPLPEEQSSYHRELKFILEALIFQLGQLHWLEQLWLGGTTVPVGVGLGIADMTDEQKEMSQAQASRTLQVLQTLCRLSCMELHGLKDVIDMDKLEIVQQ